LRSRDSSRFNMRWTVGLSAWCVHYVQLATVRDKVFLG
jgi:hypothetical protein